MNKQFYFIQNKEMVFICIILQIIYKIDKDKKE